MPQNLNFTARAARWSASHRRAAIGGWLVFVIAAVVFGGMAGFKTPANDHGVQESARADRALLKAFPEQPVEQ